MDNISAVEFAAILSDPVVFFDRFGMVEEANLAAIHAFGPLPGGTPLRLKFRAPELRTLIDNLLAGRQTPPLDHTERLPLERVYRVTGHAIGKAGQFALIFRDQSEARRIDRMRADFIANASHELRTPLASVAGFVEALRGPARDDARARAQFLEIMQQQTSRMARLLDDLLSLSRLEMKPRLDRSVQVDVASVVQSVIDTLAPLSFDNGVTIESELAAGALVVGNRDELFQVFENLIENACKYGKSGGRVIVKLAQEDDGPGPGVAISVRDFGPGIPQEHLPRLTERFYRANSESQKGTGLGLAIVKHILTRHGGWLTITSETGQGSAFTVHLPLAEPDRVPH